jgi:ribonuclease R
VRLPIPPPGHFRKDKDSSIKNSEQRQTGLLDEIEGVIQGHRDGHGYVVRDDGETDLYLPPNEMRAVLHKDRVRARIVRHDRKGRPEGRVVEIVERPPQPIIGRLLHESGVWLVAPEDKRYGQDVLIPKTATGTAKPGQVVVVELTEPPSLYGQPVGRVKEVLGEIDDPGMEIEIAVRKYGVPHEFSDACIAMARTLPDKVRPADRKHRVDLTDVPLVTIDGEDATSTMPSTASRPRWGAARAGAFWWPSPTSATTSRPAAPSTSTRTTAPPASTSRAG